MPQESICQQLAGKRPENIVNGLKDKRHGPKAVPFRLQQMIYGYKRIIKN